MLPESARLEFKQPELPKITDPGKSFKFDFAVGEFVLTDGRLTVIDGIEAIKIWVEKIIRTERFRFRIYERKDGNEYGLNLINLLGTVLPRAFVEAELKREVREAVIRHPRIASISNLATEQDGSLVKISFRINLIDGQTYWQEVAFSG